GKERIEAGVAEVHAVVGAQDADAVEAELVEGVGNLVDCAGDVGERQDGQDGEAGRLAPDELGGVLVDRPGQNTGLLAGRKGQGRLGNAHHLRPDTVAVHELDGELRGPLRD